MKSPAMVLVVYTFLASLISAQLLFPTETTPSPCITVHRGRGQCILAQNCPSIYASVKNDPPSENDINILRISQCGALNGNILVCCPVQIAPEEPSSTISQSPTEPDNILPQPGTCGTGSTDHIYGGDTTKIDEFPWMALVGYSTPENNTAFLCGGTLINNRYVLTAGHCVYGKAIPTDWHRITVRLGEWDTSSPEDCEDTDCSPPPLDVTIEQLIVHEDYNPNPRRGRLHDIALLRLSRKVPYSFWIKPICLPSAPHLRNATFEGFNMDVAGWGITETASRSNIKLKARVDGFDLSKCNDVYKRYRIKIQSSQICAGGLAGFDSCQGDSGGPLMGFDKSGRVPYFYLVGITSFGLACGTSGVPGVYTRVGSYIDWIQNTIKH